MSTFREQLEAFRLKVENQTEAVFQRVCEEVQRSVVEGSEITAAPGQPVDTGFLKASWVGEFTAPTTFELTTNVAYAPVIEEGTREAYDASGEPRPKGLPHQNTSTGPRGGTIVHRSTVGGHHSVKLTRAGFQAIVDYAVAQVNAGA